MGESTVADLGNILNFCASLFEQGSIYCQQASACFKLSDTFAKGDISLFFKILVCKINLDDICYLKQVPVWFETCPCDLYRRVLVSKRVLALLKQAPACFEKDHFCSEASAYKRFTCFIQVRTCLNQAGTFFKTSGCLFLNIWASL